MIYLMERIQFSDIEKKQMLMYLSMNGIIIDPVGFFRYTEVILDSLFFKTNCLISEFSHKSESPFRKYIEANLKKCEWYYKTEIEGHFPIMNCLSYYKEGLEIEYECEFEFNNSDSISEACIKVSNDFVLFLKKNKILKYSDLYDKTVREDYKFTRVVEAWSKSRLDGRVNFLYRLGFNFLDFKDPDENNVDIYFLNTENNKCPNSFEDTNDSLHNSLNNYALSRYLPNFNGLDRLNEKNFREDFLLTCFVEYIREKKYC